VNCTQVRPILPLYADGDLETARASAVVRHLERCDECRRRLSLDRRLTGVLMTLSAPARALESETVRPTVKAAIHRADRPKVGALSSVRARAALATIVGLIVVVLLLVEVIVAQPTDEGAFATATAQTPTAVALTPAVSSTLSVLPPAPLRNLSDLRRRIKPVAPVPPLPTAGPPRDDPIGTEHDFRVWSPSAAPEGVHLTVRARLVAKTDHANWYVQDGLDLSSVALREGTDFFDQNSFPIVHQLLGWEIPLGIDNDPRVTILLGHLRLWNQAATEINFNDLWPRSIVPESNERKMIYANLDNAQLGTTELGAELGSSLAWLAWETSQPGQDFWVKGSASGLAYQSIIGTSDDAYTANEIGSFRLQPQTELNASRPELSDEVANSAARDLFARYVAGRFGGMSAFTSIFASSERGIAAFDRLFHSSTPPSTFDDVFADWVAANFLSNPTLAGGRFGYPSNLQVNPQVLPGPTLQASLPDRATQFGASYYRIQPTVPATLSFTGDPTVRLIGADSHSGGLEWWSNRGGEIDSRVTRTVDLRSVHAATLRFWAWYQTVKDFDYAYVEVSADGGATWQTISATDTTRGNPYGLNLGNGFTGTSGSALPQWKLETADLTPYAGREIRLRFEYVTYPAWTEDGFAIDGVEIPEIGFLDSTTSDNGWTAEGFIRTDNTALQPWLVEVLSHDPAQPVRRMTIGPDGTGSLPLEAGQSVVIAVAGLSPDSTQTAQFQLRLAPR
jgi:immune inhibitor A